MAIDLTNERTSANVQTMRELNVRTFSRNIHQELLDLPITLTKYGKSFATIIPAGTEQEYNDVPAETKKINSMDDVRNLVEELNAQEPKTDTDEGKVEKKKRW